VRLINRKVCVVLYHPAVARSPSSSSPVFEHAGWASLLLRAEEAEIDAVRARSVGGAERAAERASAECAHSALRAACEARIGEVRVPSSEPVPKITLVRQATPRAGRSYLNRMLDEKHAERAGRRRTFPELF
jgi:hypothetical protein